MHRVLFVTAALVGVLTLGTGCQVARALLTTSDARAAARNPQDVAACEKMCEVAGNTEKKGHAVEACKKDCRR